MRRALYVVAFVPGRALMVIGNLLALVGELFGWIGGSLLDYLDRPSPAPKGKE